MKKNIALLGTAVMAVSFCCSCGSRKTGKPDISETVTTEAATAAEVTTAEETIMEAAPEKVLITKEELEALDYFELCKGYEKRSGEVYQKKKLTDNEQHEYEELLNKFYVDESKQEGYLERWQRFDGEGEWELFDTLYLKSLFKIYLTNEGYIFEDGYLSNGEYYNKQDLFMDPFASDSSNVVDVYGKDRSYEITGEKMTDGRRYACISGSFFREFPETERRYDELFDLEKGLCVEYQVYDEGGELSEEKRISDLKYGDEAEPVPYSQYDMKERILSEGLAPVPGTTWSDDELVWGKDRNYDLSVLDTEIKLMPDGWADKLTYEQLNEMRSYLGVKDPEEQE